MLSVGCDRFFPLTHVQLSNPGNERHQLGRKLAVDSRLVVLFSRVDFSCATWK